MSLDKVEDECQLTSMAMTPVCKICSLHILDSTGK